MLSEEQKTERLTGLGASDIPVVMMGKVYDRTIGGLIREKRGLGGGEIPENSHIRRGNRQERVALGVYHELTGADVVPAESLKDGGFVRCEDHPWAIAHLDAYAHPEVGPAHPLEVKAPSLFHYKKLKSDGELPEAWEWQCQHQLLCTGTRQMALIAYCAELDEALLFHVERDAAQIAEIIDRGAALWAAIQGEGPWPEWADDDAGDTTENSPAPVDPKALPVVEDLAFAVLVDVYDQARQTEKEGREHKELVREDIISYLEEAGHAAVQTPGGDRVYFTPHKQTRFKMREFRRDYPEIYEKYSKTTAPRRSRVQKAK